MVSLLRMRRGPALSSTTTKKQACRAWLPTRSNGRARPASKPPPEKVGGRVAERPVARPFARRVAPRPAGNFSAGGFGARAAARGARKKIVVVFRNEARTRRFSGRPVPSSETSYIARYSPFLSGRSRPGATAASQAGAGRLRTWGSVSRNFQNFRKNQKF